jgi:hypothetical protein
MQPAQQACVPLSNDHGLRPFGYRLNEFGAERTFIEFQDVTVGTIPTASIVADLIA